MRTSFALIVLGSFFTITTQAARIEEEEAVTLAPKAQGEGIPVSVNVIQTAQVVVLDKQQILSIAADINAQSAEKSDTSNPEEVEAEETAENGMEEEGDVVTEVSATEGEVPVQQANIITTSSSVSGTSVSPPKYIDAEFTFAPITLAPESSRSVDKYPSSTQRPAMKTSVILKKAKSDSNSLNPSVYKISLIAMSFGLIGQCFL